MHFIAAAVFLMMSMSALSKQVGRPLQPKQQQDLVAKRDGIMKQLDGLLAYAAINDAWYEQVNALIFELALVDKGLANSYLKKMLAKSTHITVAQLPQVPQAPQAPRVKPSPPVVPAKTPKTAPIAVPATISKNQIITKLDEKLQSALVDDAWYDVVDNLIFDLALSDRALSKEYLKKVYEKTTSMVAAATPIVPPSAPSSQPRAGVPAAPSSGGMQKGTPPPMPGAMQKGTPPPAPGGGMQKGTPPAAPAGAIKKGTPPPAPGAFVPGKKTPAGATKQAAAAAVPKGAEPLSPRQTYGMAQLKKRPVEEVLKLFNDLLDALAVVGDFWNALKKEPTLDWNNKIETVKRALLDPERMIQINALKSEQLETLNIKLPLDPAKMIKDRIAQVIADKAQQGKDKQEAAAQIEKKAEQEEFTEKELIPQIEALKKNPDVQKPQWLIKFTGAIKKLDKVNHEKAVEYESAFMKEFPGQKSFLPKKKAPEIKKELTAEEKMMASIDKILEEKQGMWAITAKNPIQELYDMNPELGLLYQEKYLAATKAATKRDDKPFLRLKK